MKKVKCLLCFVLLFAVLFVPSAAFAEEIPLADIMDGQDSVSFDNDSFYRQNYEYFLKNYDIQVDVNENNVLHVTEKINANFHVRKHGIYRYIPYQCDIRRADGSQTSVKAKISNIECSEQYEKSYEDGNIVLQIGSEDKTFKGEHSYSISYDYSIGTDTVDNSDELYFNLIGNGWDTQIENVTFTVSMPKAFDKDKIGFSTGAYSAEGSDIVRYSVKDNVITGKLVDSLNAYEALTLRIELPDGYFTFDKTAQLVKYALLIILPALCLLVIFLLWLRVGNDKKVIDVVEFYPPQGMSSADVAFWKNGVLKREDVIPLLIELANEGCVEIEERDGKNNYVINRIKDYDGSDKAKQIFFKGLFNGKNKRDSVTKSSLENRFYTSVDKIVALYSSYDRRTKVFSKKSLVSRVACWGLLAAGLALELLLFINIYGTNQRFVFLGIGAAILLVGFVMSFFVRKRTDEAHEILQKINGFKTFLEKAEKDRLEALVEENPKYFYDILPYAYVLGVSDKWIKKFKSIAIEPPTWYVSRNPFDRMMMWYFINNTMHDCSRTMISRPEQESSFGSGSGGGSFTGGGGGFAGGGFGGGGGGSW